MMNQDTSLVSFTKINEISPDEKLNLNEIDFRMAFYMYSAWDDTPRMDPRYVKFEVYTEDKNTDRWNDRVNVPYQKCT